MHDDMNEPQDLVKVTCREGAGRVSVSGQFSIELNHGHYEQQRDFEELAEQRNVAPLNASSSSGSPQLFRMTFCPVLGHPSALTFSVFGDMDYRGLQHHEPTFLLTTTNLTCTSGMNGFLS